jgi:hypothetical protein
MGWYGQVQITRTQTWRTGLGGGLTWLLKPDLQLDLYGGLSDENRTTYWQAGTGIAKRF